MLRAYCLVRRFCGLQIVSGAALSAEYHPDLAHLSWLIGTWVGAGVVNYPTMPEGIQVGQELSISHDGRPFLIHWSRTWLLDEAGNQVKPLAMEAGFWRPRPDNEVEFLLAHPTGFLESWFGKVTVAGLVNAQITHAYVELETDAIVRTASAKQVDAGKRMYGIKDGTFGWVYEMAAVGQPLQPHSSFELRKVN